MQIDESMKLDKVFCWHIDRKVIDRMQGKADVLRKEASKIVRKCVLVNT